uniref:Multidrug ABC transporter ATPase n=1 Tax=Heterorhabditis bacteriophora TaxID=37862 RepID=A0A1I7WSG9_HETBA
MDENYKKEEQQLHLPNSPEDRVKLEMERRLEDEKEDDRPIVKGGDYDNKQS